MAGRDIPEGVKLAVRQQCFFGCVLCGAPVFHYDHIEEFATVREHAVENIALLCEMHHGAKTTGKLNRDRVREARGEPYNARRQFTAPYAHATARDVAIHLGSNVCTAHFPSGTGVHHVVWINGRTYVAIHAERGWLTFSACVTDTAGAPILVVDRGELLVRSTVWDYRYEGARLQIREAPGKYLLDMEMTNGEFSVHSGMFLYDGIDGFVVQQGALHTILSGRPCGLSVGGRASANSFGAWGLLNTRTAPGVPRPAGGFGFFRGA